MPQIYRITIAVVVGVVAGILSGWHLTSEHAAAGDFSWPLQGARVLLSGGNPYTDTLHPLPYNQSTPLLYPLPAVLVALPLASFPDAAAATIFFGASSGLLAWAVLREGLWRLGIFLSMPFWIALSVSQWAPLMGAALLLPSFGWVVACKPTIGIAVLAARPEPRRIVLALLVGIICLLVLPSWPWSWWQNLSGDLAHVAPLWVFPGVILFTALLRWREWRARLVLALAAVPHLGYDLFLLQLVARTAREQILLVAGSWLTLIGIVTLGGGVHWWLIGCYFPTLLLVLKPREAEHPQYASSSVLSMDMRRKDS